MTFIWSLSSFNNSYPPRNFSFLPPSPTFGPNARWGTLLLSLPQQPEAGNSLCFRFSRSLECVPSRVLFQLVQTTLDSFGRVDHCERTKDDAHARTAGPFFSILNITLAKLVISALEIMRLHAHHVQVLPLKASSPTRAQDSTMVSENRFQVNTPTCVGLSVIPTPGSSGVNLPTQQPFTRVDSILPGGTSTAQNRPTKETRGRTNLVDGRQDKVVLPDPQLAQLSQQRRSGSDPPWLSAVKKRYKEAKARVERIQGGVTSSSPPHLLLQGSTPQPKPANAASWPTAEQEKLSPSGRRQNPSRNDQPPVAIVPPPQKASPLLAVRLIRAQQLRRKPFVGDSKNKSNSDSAPSSVIRNRPALFLPLLVAVVADSAY
ncbi:hypothetical protein JOM56_002968 [Amanita muscaria]